MAEKTTAASGPGVCGLLGVAFVVLKLTGVIDWSWWWVTAPFWGPFAVGLVVVGVLLVISGAAGLMDVWDAEAKKKRGG